MSCCLATTSPSTAHDIVLPSPVVRSLLLSLLLLFLVATSPPCKAPVPVQLSSGIAQKMVPTRDLLKTNHLERDIRQMCRTEPLGVLRVGETKCIELKLCMIV